MNLIEVLDLAKSVGCDIQKEWQDKLLSTLENNIPEKVSFTTLLAMCYALITKNELIYESGIIMYGAGDRAKQLLPQIQNITDIYQIWDLYSREKSMQTVPIVKPNADFQNKNIPIVICVDKREVQAEIRKQLQEYGYTNIMVYHDFLLLEVGIKNKKVIHNAISNHTKELMEEFLNKYCYISCEKEKVLYSALPYVLKEQQITISDDTNLSKIVDQLDEELILNQSILLEIKKEIVGLLEERQQSLFDFLWKYELFLRTIFENRIKTKYRPIRMANDIPFDRFALEAVIRITLDNLFNKNYEKELELLNTLSSVSQQHVCVTVLRCRCLLGLDRREDALLLSRNLILKETNDLLANECFYEVAKQCKENNILIEERLNEYDLKDRFCWSGLNFAWCGGYFGEDKTPYMGPCFRPLQCAALPDGEFWTSMEWQEFRKSLLDGTFRYCQKNNCPNIIGGWLPKKSEYQSIAFSKMLKGDFSIIPELEELHFSYDAHCNLKCPSCRVEINANSKEKNAELDEFYVDKLEPMVKKVKHLCLSGCGEALLSPHSRKVIESLLPEKYPDLQVELRTNVTVLNERNWLRLGEGRKVIKHIAVSIDAASRELFEKLRFPAKWDVVMENLKYIQKLRKNNEIKIFEFHVVLQEDNIEELVDIIKMAIEHDADVITFSKIINWRNIESNVYHNTNPFWVDSVKYTRLKEVIKDILDLRNQIENDECEMTKGKKKIMINLHGYPDPSSRYDSIRYGELKIR